MQSGPASCFVAVDFSLPDLSSQVFGPGRPFEDLAHSPGLVLGRMTGLCSLHSHLSRVFI